MKTLYIYQGIQGSGKSTQAKKFVLEKPNDRIRINRDDIRLMMGLPFNPNVEDIVTNIETSALKSVFVTGKDIVSDNMNLNPKVIKHLKTLAEKYEYSVEFRFVYTPLEECIARDAKREHPVGEQVIRNTYNKYKEFIEQHKK